MDANRGAFAYGYPYAHGNRYSCANAYAFTVTHRNSNGIAHP
jgi:hypothetical protein